MEEKKNNAFEKVENVIKQKQKEGANKQYHMDDVAWNDYEKKESSSVTIEKETVRAVQGEPSQSQIEVEPAVMNGENIDINKKPAQIYSNEVNATALENQKRQKHLQLEKKRADKMAKKIEERENRRLKKQERKAMANSTNANNSQSDMVDAKNINGTNNSHKKGDDKKHQKRNGWMAAAVSLGVVSAVLTGVLAVKEFSPTSQENLLENVYRKSFYQTVEEVDNIDLNLSKLLATNDKASAQQYLLDLAVNSEVAESEIQQLPLHDENKFYTTKLINQIGDYAKYLNKKLLYGEELTDRDRQNIENLYMSNLALKESLQSTMSNMGEDFNFSNMGVKQNVALENFSRLQNLSVDFPQLIYDGPFSDGQSEREIKGLPTGEITQAEAKDIFIKTFGNKTLEQVENVGTTVGDIECYNVSAIVDGSPLYAQISKRGGKMILFDCPGSCNAQNFSADYVTEKAQKFLQKVGINDMKAVWINLAGNVYTINFAYEQNGVVMYPDLVKVRVCAETADVIGMEAKSYYTNHYQRVVKSPTLSKDDASSYVNSQIQIETSRLAVVPVGQSGERLCYEFSGTKQGDTFYVYIDAINGRQVEMFKVIESTEGMLLM